MAVGFQSFAPDANKTAGSRARRFGELLQKQGSDTSPVYGWGQGLARLLSGYAGIKQLEEADKLDKEEYSQGVKEIFGQTAADQWTNPDTGQKVGATREDNQRSILENSDNPYTQNFRLLGKMRDMENEDAIKLAEAKAKYDVPETFKTFMLLKQMENGGNPAPNLMPNPQPAPMLEPQVGGEDNIESIELPPLPNTENIDYNEAANASRKNPDGSFQMPPEVQPVAPQFAENSMADDFLNRNILKKSDKTIRAEQQAPKILQDNIMKADRVMNKVDEALVQLQSGEMASGFVGGVTQAIPGSPAFDLSSTIDTVQAVLGFEELQKMRDNSPTGGALGQVAVRELEMLQATIASLKVGQSPKQLAQNLAQVKLHYSNWKDAVMQAQEQGQITAYPRGQAPVSQEPDFKSLTLEELEAIARGQ